MQFFISIARQIAVISEAKMQPNPNLVPKSGTQISSSTLQQHDYPVEVQAPREQKQHEGASVENQQQNRIKNRQH
jgi:hypothetical protein